MKKGTFLISKRCKHRRNKGGAILRLSRNFNCYISRFTVVCTIPRVATGGLERRQVWKNAKPWISRNYLKKIAYKYKEYITCSFEAYVFIHCTEKKLQIWRWSLLRLCQHDCLLYSIYIICFLIANVEKRNEHNFY